MHGDELGSRCRDWFKKIDRGPCFLVVMLCGSGNVTSIQASEAVVASIEKRTSPRGIDGLRSEVKPNTINPDILKPKCSIPKLVRIVSYGFGETDTASPLLFTA